MFRLYDLYSFQVIPVMGEVIAKDWKSYQYLVESIRQFPAQVQNFCNLWQRLERWNGGDPCRISLCVLGGVQGDDRRCRFSESDLWKSNIRHRGHSLWLQTVTPSPSWSMNHSHPVKSLQLKGNQAGATSNRTSPLKDMCLGLMFWGDQSQSGRNKFLSLYFAFTRNCFLRAFSPRYCACSVPAIFPQLCSVWLSQHWSSVWSVWSFSAGSDFQDNGSFESNDLN